MQLPVLTLVATLIVSGCTESDAPPDAPSSTAGGGWHTESYRDLTLQVPVDWGYSSESDWCDDTSCRPIRAAVTTIETFDANGCPPDSDFWDPQPEPEASVCRYSHGLLEQSERLDVGQTDRLRAAVFDAPELHLPADELICAPVESSELVVVVVDGDRIMVELPTPGGCFNGEVTLNSRALGLTEDLLYWALSPGWDGALAGRAPLPDPLRTD